MNKPVGITITRENETLKIKIHRSISLHILDKVSTLVHILRNLIYITEVIIINFFHVETFEK